MAQPLGERSDVARQPMRLGLGLPRKRQLGGKLVVWTPLAGAADLGPQLLTPRGGALDEVLQDRVPSRGVGAVLPSSVGCVVRSSAYPG